jgi:hypothetical protein
MFFQWAEHIEIRIDKPHVQIDFGPLEMMKREVYLAFMSHEIRGDVIISAQNHDRAKEIVKWTRDWCLLHKNREYFENIEFDAKTHLLFKTGMRSSTLGNVSKL